MSATLNDCLESHEQLEVFGNLIHERFKVHEYQQIVQEGDLAFTQGDIKNGLYFLMEGKVRIILQKPDYVEAFYKDVSPGELVVEMADQDEPPPRFPYSCRALESSTLAMLPRQAILHIIDNQLELKEPYLEYLREYPKQLQKEMDRLTYTTLPQRIAQEVSTNFTVNKETREYILPPSHQSVSALFGAPQEAVETELRQLHEAGVIKLQARHIEILDLEKLKAAI